MMAIALFPIWWTATREIGFSSYAVTALVCLWFSFRTRRAAWLVQARIAGLAAVAEFFLALDIVFEWRLFLHDFLAGTFVKYNLYSHRHTFQLVFLVAVSCILFLSLSIAFHSFRDRKGALLAVCALFVSFTLWFIEVISLHETDSALYHLVNGVMVIAFLWVITCALTLLGIGMDSHCALRKG
jgi:hypothetical protein